MRNDKSTIKNLVSKLNIPEQDGGYWLPQIQRKFVWKGEQVEKLFDSLMRSYPISTLLIWKTTDAVQYRKFIENYHKERSFHEYVAEADNQQHKYLVLDGQQRLQSLLIALKGTYNKKELYFDVLSGTPKPPEDQKYTFKFMEKKTDSSWIKVKDCVYAEDIKDFRREIITSIDNDRKNITTEERYRIEDNIDQLYKVLTSEEVLSYQLLDSVTNSNLYSIEDVVEIFIRANDGGTKLSKSDLVFSLLTSAWEEGEEKIGNLLDDLNGNDQYAFDRDFILKTCFAILGHGAGYKVDKLRDIEIRDQIINEWQEIENSIKAVKDYLSTNTYLRSKKAFKAYTALIPVIYFRYRYKDKWDNTKLDNYILRTLLAGSFGGSPDSLLNNCIEQIKQDHDFKIKNIYSVIRKAGKKTTIYEEDLLDNFYHKVNNLHLIFNLWYKNANYNPSYDGNELHIDHIFPQVTLKEQKINNRRRYTKNEINQLANLMLLTKDENGPANKGTINPEIWFEDKNEEYLEKHAIPKNKDLWKVENYKDFIKKREELIVKKLKVLGVIATREKTKV